MKTKDMRSKLRRPSGIVSTESNNGVDGLPFPAEANEASLDNSDDQGVVSAVVEPPELLTELQDALADIDIHVKSMEALVAVSDTVAFANAYPSTSLESSILTYLTANLMDPNAATRMVANTISGSLQCGADLVAFEEMASNAAKSHWQTISTKIQTLSQKNGELTNITAEAGKRISEQFKALKSQVWAYKGGNTIKVSHLINEGSTFEKAIFNTQQSVALDIGLKSTVPMDRAVDTLASKSASIINSGKSDQLSAISATAVKTAQDLARAYSTYDETNMVLGYVRTAMDDEASLPEGIVSALTGAERKYNYPRYKRIRKGSRLAVVLTPQLAKQLYDLGLHIARDITEQSRAWDMRLGTLKGLADLAKNQSGNVDADKNTWAAEQRAATNVLSMWTVNASARRYYISVYNKIASQILDILNSATAVSGKANLESYSQELFGFGKPKEVHMLDALRFVQSNISKVEAKTINVNMSLLGNTPDLKAAGIFIDKTLQDIKRIMAAAKGPFDVAYEAMGVFEENDDEDALDSTVQKAMLPFTKMIGKGIVINHLKITAEHRQDGDWNIDGEFAKPPVNNIEVAIDGTSIKGLYSQLQETSSLLEEIKLIPYLEYGQSYCTWLYELNALLKAMRHQLVTICLKAIGDKVTISQELFGWGKKEEPKATPTTTGSTYQTPAELISVMQGESFVHCDPNASLNMLGYNTDFTQHARTALQAFQEYSNHYTEQRFHDFIKTVNGLTDNIYTRMIDSDHALKDDWRTQGNEILNEVYNRLLEDGVYLKFWNMTRVANNGVRTNFALQPNIILNSKGNTETANPKLTKLTISKVTDSVALDFLKRTKDIQTWALTKEMDDNRFLATFSKFGDAFIQMIYSPVMSVNSNMDDLLSFTHDLIAKSIVTNDTE